MKETTSLALLFLFGCVGLFIIYGHQADDNIQLENLSNPSSSRYIHQIQYYPRDEHCVEVILSQPNQNIWLDFGDGKRQLCTQEKAYFRYKDAGLFTIRAYQEDKLVDMGQLDAGAF